MQLRCDRPINRLILLAGIGFVRLTPALTIIDVAS